MTVTKSKELIFDEKQIGQDDQSTQKPESKLFLYFVFRFSYV